MRIRTTVTGGLDEFLLQRTTAPDRAAMLAGIGSFLRRAFARNFAESGRPTWPPLTERTQKEKMRLYLGGIIRGRKVGGVLVNRRSAQPLAPGALFPLIRSGALRNAATRRGATGNVTRIDADAGTLEVGVNLVYGGTHQYGNPDKNVPARPYLLVTEEELDEITNYVLAMEAVALALSGTHPAAPAEVA